MVYGQFTGYEPAPDGGYLFTRANGPPLRFANDAAEQLKARLDASANLQPKVAGPGGGPIDQIGGYGSENAPPSPEQIQSFRDQLAPAPAAAPKPVAPAPGGQLGYGLSVSPQGTIQHVIPGSPGISQQQLQSKAGKGTELPTSVSESTQGAIPADQDYLESRTEMNLDKRLLLDKERESAVEAAEAESKLAEQQFANQARLQSEEQARIRDLETRVAREEDLKNKAFAEYTGSKVDPGRLFSNPAARAAASIFAAGGAWAAVMSKTPNFAQQILDSSIDRDIHAQEAAIRLKGDKANNALSNLRQSGMTLEQSRAALKGIQLDYQRSELAKVRARNAVPALQTQYDKLDMALQEGLLEANEQYRRESIGKTMRTVNSTVAYPVAPTAARRVDVRDQLGTAKEIQALKKGEADIAKTEREATKGPAASPEKRKAMGALAEVARLQKSLDGLPDDKVIVAPEDSNFITRNVAGAAETIGGKGAGARFTMTEKERRDLADVNAAKEQIKNMRSVLSGQGALDEQGSRRSEAALAPGATAGEVKRALADLYSAAEAANIAADATGEAGGNVVTK